MIVVWAHVRKADLWPVTDPATGRPRWRWRRCHVFRWPFR